ncbi:MAG TPA: hypothetical protein DDZ39_09610 [Flavobacteriaceae bacterium]|jgi:hypothetical protein|nr:hypothetical protein [Flavobacteriaceae bacterium]HBS11151.1 hypothetical protein [Flavobacteriaceae bacterium]
MRNLIVTVVVLMTLTITAQENYKLQNTIEINTSVDFKREIISYRAKIIISLDQISYGNSECNTFEDLKQRYFTKLEAKGIDTNKFKENKLEYLGMYYQKEGTIYTYETSSKEEISKMMSVRINGVTNSSLEYQLRLDDQVYDKLLEEALVKAKNKANRIALQTNRKIGKIVRIEDGSSDGVSRVYYAPQSEVLHFSITFEML